MGVVVVGFVFESTTPGNPSRRPPLLLIWKRHTWEASGELQASGGQCRCVRARREMQGMSRA